MQLDRSGTGCLENSNGGGRGRAAHLYEDGGEPLLAQLLVHAEEVDFDHGDGRGARTHRCRHTRDERHELVARAYSHPQHPLLLPPRRLQRPLQKFLRVFEPA